MLSSALAPMCGSSDGHPAPTRCIAACRRRATPAQRPLYWQRSSLVVIYRFARCVAKVNHSGPSKRSAHNLTFAPRPRPKIYMRPRCDVGNNLLGPRHRRQDRHPQQLGRDAIHIALRRAPGCQAFEEQPRSAPREEFDREWTKGTHSHTTWEVQRVLPTIVIAPERLIDSRRCSERMIDKRRTALKHRGMYCCGPLTVGHHAPCLYGWCPTNHARGDASPLTVSREGPPHACLHVFVLRVVRDLYAP